MKKELLNYFWVSIRKNVMWRDSKSGIVEKQIEELISNIIERCFKNTEEEKLKIKLRLKQKYDFTEIELNEILNSK